MISEDMDDVELYYDYIDDVIAEMMHEEEDDYCEDEYRLDDVSDSDKYAGRGGI